MGEVIGDLKRLMPECSVVRKSPPNISDVVSFTNSQPVRVRSSLLSRDVSAVRDTS